MAWNVAGVSADDLVVRDQHAPDEPIISGHSVSGHRCAGVVACSTKIEQGWSVLVRVVAGGV